MEGGFRIHQNPYNHGETEVSVGDALVMEEDGAITQVVSIEDDGTYVVESLPEDDPSDLDQRGHGVMGDGLGKSAN